MRISARKSGNATPITLGIIFAIVGGAVFLLFALPHLQYSNTSENWPSVTGIITRSEVYVARSDGKTHYRPDIAYTYSVGGKMYVASKITVGDPPLNKNVAPAKLLQAEYPVGKEVIVYYDPEVPESSALIPGTKTGVYLLAGVALIFFFVGLLAIYQGLKEKRHSAERAGLVY